MMSYMISGIIKIIVNYLFPLLVSASMFACGGGGSSTTNGSPPPSAIPAPQDFTAVAGVRENTLTWSRVANADHYTVYWSTSANVSTNDNVLIPENARQLTHTGLDPNTTYYYIVTASANGEEGAPSEVIMLTPLSSSNWVPIHSGTSKSLCDIAWNGSQYVAVGDYAILTSTDATNWIHLQAGTGSLLKSVIWGGGQFVAVGDDGVIYVSPNAMDWTVTHTRRFLALTSVAWTGTQYVAIAKDSNVLTSPDGIQWTGDAFYEGMRDVVWTGSKLVAVGTRLVATSLDGNQWATQKAPELEGLRSVLWTGSEVLAVGSKGAFITSADGLSWDRRSTGASATLAGVTYTGSEYIAVSNQHGTDILHSVDGKQWTPQPSPVHLGLNSIITTTDGVIAVGWGGTILVYSKQHSR